MNGRHKRASKHARSRPIGPLLIAGSLTVAAVAAISTTFITSDHSTSPVAPIISVASKPAPKVTITAPAPPRVIIAPAPPTRVIIKPAPPPRVIIEPAPPPAAAPYTGNDVVAVTGKAARHHAARAVAELLTDYFNSVNMRDHRLYRLVHTRAAYRSEPAKWALEGFISAFGSTSDSQIRLLEIGSAPDGRLTATVSFVSRQAASAGPNGQTCTRWTIVRSLEVEDSKLRIGKAPRNYARYFAC